MSESEGYTNTRRSPRVEPPEEFVVLVESFGQFLEQHARDISEGGMFLRSAAPPPPGTHLRFAIRLADGFPLIQGEGEVVWRREQREGPFDPPGMGIRFLSLEEQGRELVRRLVEERRRMPGSGPGLSSDAVSGAGAGQAGMEARQALDELLDVLEADPRGTAGAAGVEEEPFGPLAPSPEDADGRVGADLFDVSEGPRPGPGEAGSGPAADAVPGPEADGPPRPVEPAGEQQPDRGDLLPMDASDSADEAGEALPPAGLPEIGRPAGYYDEEEPLPPSRGRLFWPFAVTVALLALVALSYGAWQLGYLAWAGLPAPGRGEIAGSLPVQSPTPEAAGVQTPAAAEGAAVAEVAATEAPSPTPAPARTPRQHPTPAASPRPRRPSPTPAPMPGEASPATSVRSLTWDTTGDAVEVYMRFDGVVRRSQVRVTRLDGPPRILLRITGIRRQYQPAQIRVGSGPLERIRVWLHDEFRPPQLYVVLDLGTAGARVSRRLAGSELILTVR